MANFNENTIILSPEKRGPILEGIHGKGRPPKNWKSCLEDEA